MLAVLAYYVLADVIHGDAAFDIAHTVGPVVLACILAVGAYRATRVNRYAIWMPLFWFRISTATYFGVGAVLHNVMNLTTLTNMQGFFHALPYHVEIHNYIVALSVLSVLGTAWLFGAIFRKQKAVVALPNDKSLLFLAAIIIAAPAYMVKYLVVFPYAMGAFGDIVIPGTITSLARLAAPGLFLLALWSFRTSKLLSVCVCVLALIDSGAGVLRFSKADAIVPVLMLSMAILMYRVSAFRLALTALAVLVVFFTLKPIAAGGRNTLNERYGAIRVGTLSERLEILQLHMSQFGATSHLEARQSFSRLVYLPSVALAIDLYDRQVYGATFNNVFTVFIPRALWPDKPIYDHGRKFTAHVRGADASSSTWMGWFGEAYWNAGWWGVVLAMVPAGAILYGWSRYSVATLERRSWLHLPVVFLAMYLGIRTDGSLVNELVVVSVMGVLLHFMANFATWILLAPARPEFRNSQQRSNVPRVAPVRRSPHVRGGFRP